MMRWVVRTLLAVSLVVLSVGAAAPALADESECAGSPYAEGGYVLFPVDQKYVPPPLRSYPWDCASRVADRPLDDDYRTSNNYLLMYVGITFDELVSILRSFEDQGYADGHEVNIIDDFAGRATNAHAIGADDVAAMSPQPKYVGARFSNAQDGKNIYELTYTDGTEFAGSSGLAEPVLMANVVQTEPFVDATGIADPSVFSNLRTVAEAAPSTTQAVVAGGSAVMLMLVVGYPGSLLNAVIGERYDTAMAALRRRFQKKPPPDPDAASARRNRIWLVFIGLAIAAVISGFIDPDFGVNPMSARVVVTAFLTLLVFNAGAWLLVRAIVRRRMPESAPVLRLRWGSLILLALTVLIARLLGFDPGVIFGLVVGLTFAITLSASRDATVVLSGSGFALAFAALAWIGYSILAPIADGAPGNLPLVFSSEFFSAITIEGISSLPLALLPLLALDGRKLFAWRRWVWAVGYVAGLAAFAIVMFTIPDSWGTIGGDFAKWVLLFVIFAAFSVAVWVVNAVATRRSGEHARPPAEPA